jgi:hypothetical protein
MNFPCTRLSLLLSLTLTAALHAQSLDGQVERDPNAGLAIYTFDLAGPPRGAGALFFSPQLLPNPFQLPLGPLFLDPLTLFPLGPAIPIDPLGHGQLRFQVPLSLTAGLELSFQSINLDQQNIIRLSNNAIGLKHNQTPAAPKPFSYSFAYDNNQPQVRAAFRGNPGSTVEIRVVGPNGPRASQTTQIGPNCQGALVLPVPGGLTPNDDVLILVDGALQDKVDLFKAR